MRPAALLLPLAFLLAWAVPALADELPATSEFFDEYDTNADGRVTAEEFRGAAEIFRLLDKNGDGAVSPDELGLPADFKPVPKARPRPGAGEGQERDAAGRAMQQFREKLQKMDTDKDGRVSKTEWQGPEQAFDRFDRNQDGFLDAQDAPRGARGGGDAQGKPGKDGKRGRDGKGERRAGPPPMEGGEGEGAMVERAKGQFERLDKNADGKLTADELPRTELLAGADGDKDGGITLDEFVAFVKQRATGGQARREERGPKGEARRGRFNAGMLRRWDRDGDGKVSRDEFPGQDEAFARLDADKDGFLTPTDVEAAKSDAPEGKQDAGKGAPGADAPAQPPVTGKPADPIAAQDTDGDGRLHRGEFKGTAEEWRRLDKNGDGWLTPDELK